MTSRRGQSYMTSKSNLTFVLEADLQLLHINFYQLLRNFCKPMMQFPVIFFSGWIFPSTNKKINSFLKRSDKIVQFVNFPFSRPSKSRMEMINEKIAHSQTHAQNMLTAGAYFEETLRSITTPRGGDYNNPNNDGSPDTSIASGPTVILTTHPSQVKPLHK
jgi:hypothetical protein